MFFYLKMFVFNIEIMINSSFTLYSMSEITILLALQSKDFSCEPYLELYDFARIRSKNSIPHPRNAVSLTH